MYKLDEYNPYPSFQAGQAEAITEILDLWQNGNKVIELNAPTASGKSLDLYVLGRILSEEYGKDKVIYTTPLVALVNQLEKNEKFNKMPVLKGKRNYPCALDPYIMADNCPFETWGKAMAHCRKTNGEDYDKDKGGDPCRHCAYQMDRLRFKNSTFGATTFARYVIDPSCHGDCQVLLIDESASLEKALVNYSTMKLPIEADIQNLRESVVAYYNKLLEQIKEISKEMDDYLLSSKRASEMDPEYKDMVKRRNGWMSENRKCAKVIYHIDAEHKFIIDGKRQFRLLEGRSEFRRLIEDLDLVVLASGTPTSAIYADEYKVVRVQHPIDISRRLIYYNPVGSMAKNDRERTIPGMAKKIEELHAKHHKKTMVHCSVYGIAKSIYDRMSKKNQKITILQSDPDERELYKNQFIGHDGECIFLSIAFAEGLDLKGPDYPMNIIAKVPFEYPDEYVTARNEMDNWLRYNTNAVVDVEQASGRCTRTPDDWSETHILDASWKGLVGRNRKKFEPWFLAAVRNV